MARIRTIKPDAFLSHSLSLVPRDVRWTFAGLWTYADDEGRARDDVRLVKAALYPLDDSVSLADLASDLERLASDEVACVCRYEVDGRAYFHMPTWKKHQVINRPTESKIPACPKPHRSEDSQPTPRRTRDGSRKTHGDVTEGSVAEGKGKEGNREQGTEGIPRPKRGSQLAADWEPNAQHIAKAAELELNLADEVEGFRDHHEAKGTSDVKNWDASFRTWMRNSAKWGKDKRNPNHPDSAEAQALRYLQRTNGSAA